MAEAQAVSLTYEDGARTVELAREAMESYVLNGQREQPGSMREAFYQRTGAMVRLQSSRGRGSLRGCAGDYRGKEQLGHEIVEAAIEASSDSSCGSEIRPAELSNLLVSVCIVRDIRESEDPLGDIEIGRHGIAIEGGQHEGWLYPTIPVENDWTRQEYLDRTCRKVRLPAGAWAEDDVHVVLFDTAVFREREPRGSVERF